MAESQVEIVEEKFPVSTKKVSGPVAGIPTDIMSMSFGDKILVTISQGGRLAHWVHVPLSPSVADNRLTTNFNDDEDAPASDLLPMPHLNASTVLGGTIQERDLLGQIIATQLGSAIAVKNPQEGRLLVVGMGLEKAKMEKEEFMELVELILQVI